MKVKKPELIYQHRQLQDVEDWRIGQMRARLMAVEAVSHDTHKHTHTHTHTIMRIVVMKRRE